MDKFQTVSKLKFRDAIKITGSVAKSVIFVIQDVFFGACFQVLWFFLSAMTALAVLFALWPVVRERLAGSSHRPDDRLPVASEADAGKPDADIAVYKSQLT